MCLYGEMARKRALPGPLNKIVDTALGAVKDPKGTAEKAVGQAKDTAALGRMVAEGVAGQVAHQVTSRTRGRKATDAPHAESPQGHLRPVPDVEPAERDEPAGSTAKAAPSAASKKRAAAPKKAPAKKAPATKAPATKAPAKKAPAAKPVEPEAPVAEPIIEPGKDDLEAAKEASPADVAKVAAKKAPAKKAPAKKSTAKKAPAKKSATKKAPAKKSAAKKSPARKSATGGAGDKLPPRKSTTPAPAPTPEPNPEATG